MRRGRGDRVHGLIRDIDHGFWAAQGAVPAEGGLLVVELALLPLVELPHRVVTHGAPLVLGAHGSVVRRGSHTAEALWTSLAVPWQCPVPLWVPGQHLGSMAWHVPRQRLVGDYAGTQDFLLLALTLQQQKLFLSILNPLSVGFIQLSSFIIL